LSFGLVDASVFAIQPPYATDPRPVFYGERQPMFVRTAMSTQQRGFVELVRSEDGQLLTPAEAARLLDLGSLEQLLTRENDELGASRQAGVGGGSTFGDPESAVADSMSMRSMSVAPQSPPVNRKTQAGHTVAEGPVNEWVDPDSIVVRSDFRSTVFWSPQIRTDDDGVATVDIAFADSLTEWRGTAFAVTRGTKVGVGEVTVRTRQPVIARLQAPRFFTVGDSVTISGVFNNNTDKDLRIRPMLEVDGLVLTTDADATELVTPANGEARLDWVVFADTEGEARLRLIAQGREHADAMERTYPVKAHGIEKFIASSGKVRGDRLTVRMELPPAKQDAMTLRVQVSGSMAVTMLDALPYLVDYPYGCTEQTMSRFVPTVATLKTLNDLGIEPGEAIRRVYGGIDPRYVDETHDRVSQTREAMRNLDDVTTQSLARLYDFQKSDGGWGWWKGGSSDLFMSAYVVWGLSTALEAAVDVDRERLRRGAMYLAKELVEAEDQRDLQVWMLHAIAAYRQATGDRELSAMEGRAFAELFVRKDQLNAYGRSLLALTAHAYGRNNDAVVLVRTLENGVIRDDRPDASVIIGTPGDRNAGVISRAHWGADGIAYHWSDGAVESTAWALRAMMAIDPDHVLVEPVTNWLVANRRGAHWSNTRDTAMTVLALNDYLRASGELEGDLSFDVMVNGRMVASQTIDADARLDGPRWIDVDPSLLHEGENNMTIIRRGGEGAIYYSAQATFFTLEEPIRAAGNELFVDRSYYKLVPRETLLKGVVYDRVPLLDGGYVRSGERVEVILTVDAKTDLEYLVFEDQKPAGFEPVQVRSGEAAWFRQLTMLAIERAADQNDPDRLPATRPSSHYTGRSCWVHQGLRDDRTVIFADKLPEGVWEIRYDYRAEVPGAFHGLPLVAHAMYVPEIRANSDELRVEISDRDD